MSAAIGCNAGEYAEIALGAGAASVIGFDSDRGALEAAVARASENGIDLLPLFLDATNPSPDQGWRQQERKGLAARRRGAEGVLALALVHHLVIGRNVPLDQAVGWIMEIAPTGVIEFVPKSDPRVQTMLRTRKDIFPAYDAEHFRTQVLRRARIEREQVISKSGRFLIQYAR
jgi:ribosomal protein L11 methylase PrmA